MAILEAKIAVSEPYDVFKTGNYEVTKIIVKTSDASKPPTELFIVAPVLKGTYPVLLFCHGFLLANTCYTSLLQHIASHGYIVVAPKGVGNNSPAKGLSTFKKTLGFSRLVTGSRKICRKFRVSTFLAKPADVGTNFAFVDMLQFYGIPWISMTEEIKKAALVTEWLSTGLPVVLPEKVTRDIQNLALSGHSRGGKTAFALALGKTDQKSLKNIPSNPTTPKFKALIGIDPVAGPSISDRPPPKILQYIPRSFDMSIPVSVIGTSYGNQPLGVSPPPAADGVNSSEFFNESKPPSCYFLARDYGHCDMLDDTLDDWIVRRVRSVCKSGKGSKDLMRRSVGGIVVAFLKSYLGGDEDDLNAIVDDPSIAPITLDPVIYVKE